MKVIKDFVYRSRYWLFLFTLSAAAVGSLAGAVVEEFNDKELFRDPLQNIAAEQNSWLNFKFALVGGVLGFVAGSVFILVAFKLKDTKAVKRIRNKIAFSHKEEDLFI